MAKSVKEMVAAARAEVPAIAPREAAALIGRPDVLVVDVRDAPELAGGRVKGAVHVSRGMLEFKADPQSPAHDPAFDPAKTVILYCGSGSRAALAGRTLKEMGYRDVRNLGAFEEWVRSGGAVEKP